jgi:hypothetical protein
VIPRKEWDSDFKRRYKFWLCAPLISSRFFGSLVIWIEKFREDFEEDRELLNLISVFIETIPVEVGIIAEKLRLRIKSVVIYEN